MEKVLLRRKLVLENEIIIKKWYCTAKLANHKNNKGKGLIVGWQIDKDGECAPACPSDTTEGHWECVGGQCVFIPWG